MYPDITTRSMPMRHKTENSAKDEPPSRGRVLVVDDHAAVRESVIDVLRQAGYQVSGLASAVEALPQLERESFDVVVTDLQMPAMDGLEFIRQMSQRRLPTQVIMITAHATIASAVEAMRCASKFGTADRAFPAISCKASFPSSCGLSLREAMRGKALG